MTEYELKQQILTEEHLRNKMDPALIEAQKAHLESIIKDIPKAESPFRPLRPRNANEHNLL